MRTTTYPSPAARSAGTPTRSADFNRPSFRLDLLDELERAGRLDDHHGLAGRAIRSDHDVARDPREVEAAKARRELLRGRLLPSVRLRRLLRGLPHGEEGVVAEGGH